MHMYCVYPAFEQNLERCRMTTPKTAWCPDCQCEIPTMMYQGYLMFEEHAANDGPFLCEKSVEPVFFKDADGSVYAVAVSVA